MKYKILNTLGDYFAERAKAVLNELGNVDYLQVDQKKFADIIDQYDAVVVGITPVVNGEVLTRAKKLKVVAIPANTLENIDEVAVNKAGIVILSLKDELEFLKKITGTAELACGLMIDLVRHTPWAFASVQSGRWNREDFRGHNLFGKTLGVVGMGRLGNWMARYGVAFGMKVIFYDPYKETSEMAHCEKVSFEEVLSLSDVISIHVHLNQETERMFNKATFSKMKKGAFVVNTARGKVIDEGDLIAALESNLLGGYATDVLADELQLEEKDIVSHPLVKYSKTHNNVIIVPHIGGMTHESREKTDIFIAKKLENYLKNDARN